MSGRAWDQVSAQVLDPASENASGLEEMEADGACPDLEHVRDRLRAEALDRVEREDRALARRQLEDGPGQSSLRLVRSN